MPRERYASDDARLKVRPHVKVHLTTRSHARTVGAWSDPEMRGMIVGLWQLAAEAFAGRTADTVHLGITDVAWITGKRRRDVALTSLQRLADVMGYSLELRGDVAVIQIRNFSKKQGFNSAARGVTPAAPPPSDSDSDTDTHTEGREESAPAETASAAPPAPKAKRPREPKPIPPEAVQFATDFLDGLRARHPGFQGPATLATWSREARLMLEQRPLEEARDLAQWLFEDSGRDAEFWRRNILGVPKFREQYDRLLVLRRGASYGSSDAVRPGPITQALRNLAARAARECN